MSGSFSAAWLDRREPADARACNAILQGRLEVWCDAREQMKVVDLGAGTGASLRRMQRASSARQSWLLVERDPDLIAAGTARLAGEPAPVRYLSLDLAADLEALAAERPALITASALLDLVGVGWLQRLAALRARLDAALHVVLSVDGRVRWSPPDDDDPACMALVGRHQRSDKGFGPALGPEATPVLHRLLASASGELLLGRSDWRLGDADAALQAELLQGYVAAATATDPNRSRDIGAWGERRAALLHEPGAGVLVGHLDLLFLPDAG